MIGIELFAGAGGMSLGAEKAGIKTGLAVEIDQHAATTYKKNHPSTTVYNGDIADLTPEDLAGFSDSRSQLVVFGGPPCQGFSYSNPRFRRKDNPGNWLFVEFLRVVGAAKPDWVVFENVRGIENTAGGLFLNKLGKGFEALGYEVACGILNAKDFGVPQDRSRFFLVANRHRVGFIFPRAPSPVYVTVAEAIGDLPDLPNGADKCRMEYGRAEPSDYARQLRGELRESANHLVSKNSPLVLERYRYIPQGGNWRDIPERLMNNYQDRSRCHMGIYHRLDPAKPSIVIGNYRKNMLIHPQHHRGLSVREAARIQSFPDEYQFYGSIGFQQQQVGNAVPPLLAEAVFSSIVRQNKHAG